MACLSNGSVFQSGQKLHRHSDGPLYTVSRDEKLDVQNVFADEDRRAKLICLDGYA